MFSVLSLHVVSVSPWRELFFPIYSQHQSKKTYQVWRHVFVLTNRSWSRELIWSSCALNPNSRLCFINAKTLATAQHRNILQSFNPKLAKGKRSGRNEILFLITKQKTRQKLCKCTFLFNYSLGYIKHCESLRKNFLTEMPQHESCSRCFFLAPEAKLLPFAFLNTFAFVAMIFSAKFLGRFSPLSVI